MAKPNDGIMIMIYTCSFQKTTWIVFHSALAHVLYAITVYLSVCYSTNTTIHSNKCKCWLSIYSISPLFFLLLYRYRMLLLCIECNGERWNRDTAVDVCRWERQSLSNRNTQSWWVFFVVFFLNFTIYHSNEAFCAYATIRNGVLDSKSFETIE